MDYYDIEYNYGNGFGYFADYDMDDDEDTESDYSDELYELECEVLEQNPKQRYFDDGLYYALETQDLALAKTFLKLGADPNAESSASFVLNQTSCPWLSRVPLEIAAMHDEPEVFQFLLDNGADPNKLWESLDEGVPEFKTHKFLVKHPKFLWIIIDSHLNKTIKMNYCGEAYSCKELEKRRQESIYRLIAHLIKLETQKDPPDAILEALEMLLQFGPTNLLVPDEPEPRKEGVKSLLCLAIEHKSLRYVKAILKSGTQALSRDSSPNFGPLTESVPLHVAFGSRELEPSQLPLHVASATDQLDIVMYLLEHGVMCTKSKCGLLPVDMAYKTLAENVLRFFLWNGFSSEKIIKYPIHIKCFFQDFREVQLMINCGFNINAKDSEGREPIQIAIQMKDVCTVMLLIGSIFNDRAKSPGKPLPSTEVLRDAVRYGTAYIFDVVLRFFPGIARMFDVSLVHDAVSAGNQATFDKLLELGVNIHRTGDDNLRPIHVASKLGHLQMLKTLIKRGADLDESKHVVYTSSPTPLDMCTDTNCIRFLLKHNIEVGLTDSNNISRSCIKALKATDNDIEILQTYVECDPSVAFHLDIFEYACYEGHMGLIGFLLSKNPDLKNHCHCIEFFPFEAKKHSPFNTTMKYLADQGCDFNFSRSYTYAGKDCGEDSDRDERQLFGQQLFNNQMFLFTQVLQDRCGRYETESIDKHGFLRLMLKTKDQQMIMLLRDSGIKVVVPTDERSLRRIYFDDEKEFEDGMDYISDIERAYRQPLSLKNASRIAVRRQMFSVVPEHSSIKEAIEQLPILQCFKEFISFSGWDAHQYLTYFVKMYGKEPSRSAVEQVDE